MAKLTKDEEALLIELLEQSERERVSPKIEEFRKPFRIKLAKGGRGAGAKSWGIASLLIQRAHREKIRVGCFREIQKSLKESAYALIKDTIERLKYSGWNITKEKITSSCGSEFIFAGLKDITAADQVKGLENFDIFWLEEASVISNESLLKIMPTLRKPGSELWASYNPETEFDPVDIRLWNSNRDDVLRIWLEPGREDNPWWTKELDIERAAAYEFDPDEAEHVWGGQPRKQGVKCVMSRILIRAAMNRDIVPEGGIVIGVDVARFGDDKTVMFKRHGMKVIEKRKFAGQDLVRTAQEAWDMANRDPDVLINVDETGVGGGVVDLLRSWGANVAGINNNEVANNSDKYANVATEMWFEFPVDEADLLDDNVLMQDLAGRQYDYDKKERRIIEPKKDYKERLGRSPDDGDALLLTFYHRSSPIDKDLAEDIRARRARGR